MKRLRESFALCPVSYALYPASQAMPEKDQLRRIQRWAEAPDAAEFEAVLGAFQPAMRARVAAAKKLLHALAIHKVITTLRA